MPEAFIRGPGTFGLPIVGEASYQDALEHICGGRTEEGVDEIVDAVLVPEDSNPYDRNAIRVDIAGYTVGYLSRDHARAYRAQIRGMGHPRLVAGCRATIRGGWDRGPDDHGHFGVWLDLPVDDDTAA